MRRPIRFLSAVAAIGLFAAWLCRTGATGCTDNRGRGCETHHRACRGCQANWKTERLFRAQ